jgi:glycerol-3-phosphate dehydrogenase
LHASTQTISREHTIEIAPSKLLTVTGGKWTTYRSMADDVLTHAMGAGLIPKHTAKCQTETLAILGCDSPCNRELIGSVDTHEPQQSQVDDFVAFAMQHEFARNASDILARRSRLLFLDASKAAKLAPAVATTIEKIGFINPQLAELMAVARQYQTCP